MTLVQSIEADCVRATANGAPVEMRADLIVWAGGARALPWLAASGLACDGRGFVRVDQTLRSVNDAKVFASGDCASFSPPLPKAGVYPVKQAGILADNLAAALSNKALRNYTPQPRTLSIFATGPKHAIASWGAFGIAGDWVWRLKDRIDRAFLAKHTL
jgi:selenide, water dikinase